MTPAEAQIWIATFAAARVGLATPTEAIATADHTIAMLRSQEPQAIRTLDAALARKAGP